MTKLVEKNWDYSLHAPFYSYRPNYDGAAIDLLVKHVGAIPSADYTVVDVGAGTGNLTLMLLERGLHVVAVEPNDEMRAIGVERTGGNSKVKWVKATGISTTLPAASARWVTFGSSFNVVDRAAALRETHRLLANGGHFSCMWNHRNLNDPIQTKAEEIIVSFVPSYDRGVRRQDQRPILEEHRELFRNILYIESDFDVPRTIDEYVNAWKSVKNPYWDLATAEGEKLFTAITQRMRRELPATFKIQYTTRAWTAQKV